MSEHTEAKFQHDREMARDFLSCLDPDADRFTFQFFADSGVHYAEIFHGTLDQAWAKVRLLNTPERRVGVFVTINETDLKGRRSENIIRPRALFLDADTEEQVTRCLDAIALCEAKPSAIVKSGRGLHFYYFCSDIPRDQFTPLQKSLIEKFQTDTAIHDLPRVMRLPGTLHLKNPMQPRLVQLCLANSPIARWKVAELAQKLELSPTDQKPRSGAGDPFDLSAAERERLQKLFGSLPKESLAEGLETDIEEIRSAVAAIPPSAISAELDWMKFARALAHEAAVHKSQSEDLWNVLDSASQLADGYDQEENRRRWFRYTNEAFNREKPITIATLFDMAKKYGWCGRPTDSSPSSDSLKPSFSKVRHRRWLYGVDLVRGELTVIGSPGGVGKSSLALGMAISIATGRPLLHEKVYGGPDLKSLYLNAEDSGMEMQRRAWAFCLKHGLTESDLHHLYLVGTDDEQLRGLTFLRTTDRNFVLDQAGFDRLEALITAARPDLVVLDPLIALCGGGNVNDNAAMSSVIRELKRLAIKYDCALLVIHHNRKGGEPGNAEAISGAASIVNLARRAIMPVTMSENEAGDLHVLPSERYRHFKLVDAKSNLAPRSADTPWYELCSVELPNPEPPVYPNGDRVQAIARKIQFQNSASAAQDDQKIQRAILDLINRGKLINGQSYPYSPSHAGVENERAFMPDARSAVISATAPQAWHIGDLEVVIKASIKKMKFEGWLVEDDMKRLMAQPGRFRKGRGMAVDWPRTPWADDHAGQGNSTDALPGAERSVSEPDDGGQLVNADAIN